MCRIPGRTGNSDHLACRCAFPRHGVPTSPPRKWLRERRASRHPPVTYNGIGRYPGRGLVTAGRNTSQCCSTGRHAGRHWRNPPRPLNTRQSRTPESLHRWIHLTHSAVQSGKIHLQSHRNTDSISRVPYQLITVKVSRSFFLDSHQESRVLHISIHTCELKSCKQTCQAIDPVQPIA